MLNAFLHGKKRGTGVEGESLADTFEGAEDTLTSVVFERLLYLPDAIVGRVLLEPFLSQEEQEEAARAVLDRYEFWPRYEHSGSEVEPDAVLFFKRPKVVLVIEAKRWDGVWQQSAEQLANEWRAVRNAYRGEAIWVLAVGGFHEGEESHLRKELLQRLNEDAQFHAIPWHALYRRIEAAIACLPSPWMDRVLNDIAAGMRLHGVMPKPPSWLEELINFEYRGFRDGSLQRLLSPCN